MEKECPTCTDSGKESWFLGYCDKHNVCVDCGVNRKDLKGKTAWGARYGAFLCEDCEVVGRMNRIKERQDKGFEHEYTDEIVCPYCGNECSDSWEMEDSGEVDCDDCRQTFTYERIVTVKYRTEEQEDENNLQKANCALKAAADRLRG